MAKTATLFVQIPVTGLDENMSEDDLQSGAVDAITMWLSRGQALEESEFGPGPYHLETGGITVWTADNFTAELKELGGEA